MNPAKKNYRFVIETILFLTYAVFGLSWIAITPLIGDLQAEFQINSAQLGMLNTMVSIAKVIAPLLTGLLAVRIGLKKTIMLGTLCICCAALAPFAPSYPLFLASRFVFGIGGAIVVTLLGPMVMGWFPKEELPLVNAFNNVAVNTGIAITLFTTVPLAARLGWRHTLLVYACLSIVLMVAWAFLGKDQQVEKKDELSAERPVRYMDVWRMKETWLIAIAFTSTLALYLALNTWLPKYYMEAFGMGKAMASQYTGLFNLIGIPSAIAGGLLTKKLGLRRPFLIASGSVVGFAAFGMFLFNNHTVILVSAVLLGIAFFIATSPLFTAAMELPGVTARHIALMMGTVFSFAYVFSSLSPLVVGLLRDATGSFIPGLSLWAALSWIMLICGILLPETGPNKKNKDATKPVAKILSSK